MTGNRAPTAVGDTLSPPRNLAGALRPYPEYKESGVEWLGQVPKHWNVMAGRACYSERKESNKGLKETTVLSLSYGKIIVKSADKLHGLVPESFETYQIIEPGDIIIRPTDLQNDWNSLRFGFSPHRGIITSAYLCFRPKKPIDAHYGHLLLHTYDLKKVFYGLGSGLRQNLDWRDFKYLPCVVPPHSEQAAIVKFLENADRRIRHFIHAKSRLIVLLNEQKQAIINHAVTRGIDPNVRFKTSGIEWIGDVVEHWKISPLRRYFNVLDCKHLTVPFIEEGIPLASVSEVQKFDLDLSNAKKTSTYYFKILIQGGRKPHRGDIIYCRNTSVGAAAYVNTDEDIAMGQDVCLIRSITQNSRFLNYLLNNLFVKQQLNTLLVGSTIKRINVADIKNLIILVPPKIEQDNIVEYLDRKNEQINNSLAFVKYEINLIREYHTRLISDVVTGKVDVRSIQIQDEMPVDIEDIGDIDVLDDNGDDNNDDDDGDNNEANDK